jgi:hypothetical protein
MPQTGPNPSAARHNAIIREEVKAHGGFDVKAVLPV